jgi:hypothetical protein
MTDIVLGCIVVVSEAFGDEIALELLYRALLAPARPFELTRENCADGRRIGTAMVWDRPGEMRPPQGHVCDRCCGFLADHIHDLSGCDVARPECRAGRWVFLEQSDNPLRLGAISTDQPLGVVGGVAERLEAFLELGVESVRDTRAY